MGLSRKSSLRSRSTIGRVIGKGRTFAWDALKLNVLPGKEGSRNLFAFAVPKHGHCIVERNKLKRRLQEIVRAVPLGVEGVQAVLRCGPGAYGRTFDELKEAYSRLVGRITV